MERVVGLVAAELDEAAAAAGCETPLDPLVRLLMILVALASTRRFHTKVSTPQTQRAMITSGMSLGFMMLLALVTLFARQRIPHWTPSPIVPLMPLSAYHPPSYSHFNLL